MSNRDTFEFQAEARQLLELMVHSVYSNKDIFLRELISNASDALDKLRLTSMIDKELAVDTSDLHIAIEVDPQQHTLAVRDNGIGMSREEVVDLIGTIARSGTAELARKLREAQDAAAPKELIGQFGIGFYSTFMVADRVTLETCRAGETKGTRWESTGEGSYTVEDVDGLGHGTTVTLHLRPADNEDRLFDYTAEWKIRQIVKQYSDFIAWPIRMAAPRPAEGEDEAAEGEREQAAEPQTLNSQQALWARPRAEVSDQEYHQFYKHISHDWQDPLEIIQMRGEGHFEYEALLFIPAKAPFDLFTPEATRGLQLYVKRVQIMEACETLLPNYLRFVRGVVDAHDLSLNISRELLQQDRQIQIMRRRLVKKVLGSLKDVAANDPERYRTFWDEFGRVLKEGLVEDRDNQETILELLLLSSTHDAEQLTGLSEYVARMVEGQSSIFYLTGESRSMIENSPHMEAFRAKGYEVLALTDPIDEMWVERVSQFDGKPFQSIAKGQIDLETEEEKQHAETERAERNQEFAGLLQWLGTALQDEVKQVRLSSRLTTSPACIVGDDNDVTPTMEKLYRAMGQELPPVKRILELNPSHPLVTGLREAHEQGAEPDTLTETAELLYGTALLAEGGDLKDPLRFTRLLADRLARTL